MRRHLTTSSHVRERGFTIAEMVLVVFILAILATIAVNTVGDYQMGARDRERKADVGQIAQIIERYYRTQAVAIGATYPVTTVGDAGLTTIIDNPDVTSAPDTTSTSIVIASSASAQTPTVSEYIYQPLYSDGNLCTTTVTIPCAKYKLYYRLEATDAVVTVDSLRQQ